MERREVLHQLCVGAERLHGALGLGTMLRKHDGARQAEETEQRNRVADGHWDRSG
jgi:hypothetical protein